MSKATVVAMMATLPLSLACSGNVDPTTLTEEAQEPVATVAPSAATLHYDVRYGMVVAVIDELLTRYPQATVARISLVGILGGAYEDESFGYVERVKEDADFEAGTTIFFRDLTLTARTEATMSVSVLHAADSGVVTDDFYEAIFEADSDNVWSVDPIKFKGPFDGVLRVCAAENRTCLQG